MVKLRISFNTTEELEEVIRLLEPIGRGAKYKTIQKGAYNLCYVEIKPHVEKPEKQ